jgi:hypothetical protein
MDYHDSVNTNPKRPQDPAQPPDKSAVYENIKRQRGIFQQSGMADELIRDRREEDRRKQEKGY